VIAVTRAVSPALGRCELAHLERQPIDVARAAAQHDAYERLLASLGCTVERVAPAPALPDGVFVEDTAVVVPEVAVLARPGAASRRPELDTVAAALGRHRTLRRIAPPGTLDGGDVLRLGRRVWIGLSARTNLAGAEQLRRILEPLGFEVCRVPVTGCLHLKTAVTAVAGDTLLVNPDWVDAGSFPDLARIEVDPTEPYAANALWVGGGGSDGPGVSGATGGAVVVAGAHRRTRGRLEAAGIRTEPVAISELAKAEAGVTCCSILLA
jgi:dimethylargininase